MNRLFILLQFIKKDFAIQKTYKFDNILRFAGIFLQLFLFFFIGKLIGKKPGVILEVSGGEYFPFVLVGLAFSPLFSFGLSFCSNFLREEVSYGTIENVFKMPLGVNRILSFMSTGKLLFVLCECLCILAFGFVILEIPFSFIKLIYLVFIMGVSYMIFFGVGLVAGSFILLFKRGDPVQWVLINVSDILGGVYFPVALLPGWIGFISMGIPTTHILFVARKVILTGAYSEILIPLIILFIIGVLLIFVGFYTFGIAFNKVRSKGSLAHF
ncbi:MAG: ABC transporter permease [bacterium]